MAKKPFVYVEGRVISRRQTMRGLLEEMEFGNSAEKLFAGLLANAIIETDHKMMDAFGWQLNRLDRKERQTFRRPVRRIERTPD